MTTCVPLRLSTCTAPPCSPAWGPAHPSPSAPAGSGLGLPHNLPGQSYTTDTTSIWPHLTPCTFCSSTGHQLGSVNDGPSTSSLSSQDQGVSPTPPLSSPHPNTGLQPQPGPFEWLTGPPRPHPLTLTRILPLPAVWSPHLCTQSHL